jgi:hypothetical protein
MEPKKLFDFDLNQPVKLTLSGEEGHIIARAEYISSAPSYLVRYEAADGRQVEAWWDENALEPQD